jgi:hypothetical protein
MQRRARLACIAVAIALALLQTVLLARTAWDKSDTADETRYVSSAATLWATRAFRDLCEAPVLPKWGFAIALAAAGTPLATAGSTWQDAMAHLIRGQPVEVLRKTFFAARTATIAVVVLAGLLLWRAGARFGPRVGLIAQALWCFSPTVLANGSLAALDAWSAALMCAVVLTGDAHARATDAPPGCAGRLRGGRARGDQGDRSPRRSGRRGPGGLVAPGRARRAAHHGAARGARRRDRRRSLRVPVGLVRALGRRSRSE